MSVARNAKITPYAVDKLFWLIGSGNFYQDHHPGKEGYIGRMREEFINYARNRLA